MNMIFEKEEETTDFKKPLNIPLHRKFIEVDAVPTQAFAWFQQEAI